MEVHKMEKEEAELTKQIKELEAKEKKGQLTPKEEAQEKELFDKLEQDVITINADLKKLEEQGEKVDLSTEEKAAHETVARTKKIKTKTL